MLGEILSPKLQPGPVICMLQSLPFTIVPTNLEKDSTCTKHGTISNDLSTNFYFQRELT